MSALLPLLTHLGESLCLCIYELKLENFDCAVDIAIAGVYDMQDIHCMLMCTYIYMHIYICVCVCVCV